MEVDSPNSRKTFYNTILLYVFIVFLISLILGILIFFLSLKNSLKFTYTEEIIGDRSTFMFFIPIWLGVSFSLIFLGEAIYEKKYKTSEEKRNNENLVLNLAKTISEKDIVSTFQEAKPDLFFLGVSLLIMDICFFFLIIHIALIFPRENIETIMFFPAIGLWGVAIIGILFILLGAIKYKEITPQQSKEKDEEQAKNVDPENFYGPFLSESIAGGIVLLFLDGFAFLMLFPFALLHPYKELRILSLIITFSFLLGFSLIAIGLIISGLIEDLESNLNDILKYNMKRRRKKT